jgi:hypothetical protein
MLWVPAPSVSLIVALPASVNCALPMIAESAQRTASASQNSTVPCATGNVEPFALSVTVAVNVTGVPAATVPEETVSAVVVEATGPPSAGTQTAQTAKINSANLTVLLE